MSLADLNLDLWRSFDQPAARRVAEQAAALVGGRLVMVDTVEHLDRPLHRVVIERDGQDFALIPGGTVELGFDLDAWKPTPDQAADFEITRSEGLFTEFDLPEYLEKVLSPCRLVTVPTVLMAVLDEELTDWPSETPRTLRERRLRMPTPDEWEHACGAGARTLFRWGNECPLDTDAYGDTGTGPRQEPNAFGLRIAYDCYHSELTSDVTSIYGGDGGEAVCGGYGSLMSWLPLATANRNPAMAEFVHGPEGGDVYDTFSVRPVLAV